MLGIGVTSYSCLLLTSAGGSGVLFSHVQRLIPEL